MNAKVAPCQDLTIVRLTQNEIDFMTPTSKRGILANDQVIMVACK